MLSGAVLDPSALRDLVPDFEAQGAPLAHAGAATIASISSRERGKFRFPFTPPPLANHGNYIISLNKFVKWLAGLVEAEGIDLFTGFAGVELLMDGDARRRRPDRRPRLDKHGEQKAGFESGVDIHAKVTIFADGVRGNLTKELMRRLPLSAGREPQLFALGIKELWESPRIGWRPAPSSIRWAIR